MGNRGHILQRKFDQINAHSSPQQAVDLPTIKMRCAGRVALSCGVGLCALVDPGASFVPGGQRAAVAGWGRQGEKRPQCDGVLVQSGSSSSSGLETSTTSDEYEVSGGGTRLIRNTGPGVLCRVCVVLVH